MLFDSSLGRGTLHFSRQVMNFIVACLLRCTPNKPGVYSLQYHNKECTSTGTGVFQCLCVCMHHTINLQSRRDTPPPPFCFYKGQTLLCWFSPAGRPAMCCGWCVRFFPEALNTAPHMLSGCRFVLSAVWSRLCVLSRMFVRGPGDLDFQLSLRFCSMFVPHFYHWDHTHFPTCFSPIWIACLHAVIHSFHRCL